MVRSLVPLLTRRERCGDQFFGLYAQLGFQLQVPFLFLFDGVEVLLMAFVDLCARFAETLPELLLVFVGYGAGFAPLVVQFLQFVERIDNRRFQNEGLGLFTKLQFGFVVLLQV